MKRSPLHRRTPLARGGQGLARTPLRRKPRPAAEQVTPDLHRLIVWRDSMCFGILAYNEQMLREGGWSRKAVPWMPDGLARIDYHPCRDRFGNEHAATDLSRLEVDHFWLTPGGTKGDRAPSDPAHLVAMCGWLNNRPPPAVIREAERAYSRWLYPDATDG